MSEQYNTVKRLDEYTAHEYAELTEEHRKYLDQNRSDVHDAVLLKEEEAKNLSQKQKKADDDARSDLELKVQQQTTSEIIEVLAHHRSPR